MKDKRFENLIKRFSYIEELDEIIENWSNSLTAREAIEKLEAVRIPCGKVLSLTEVYHHPNLKARGMICDQFDFSKWNVEKASIPNRLIKFSETHGSVDNLGPEFGQHNKDIYCGLLGYNDIDLNQWKKINLI